jgi:hypothetical protein
LYQRQRQRQHQRQHAGARPLAAQRHARGLDLVLQRGVACGRFRAQLLHQPRLLLGDLAEGLHHGGVTCRVGSVGELPIDGAALRAPGRGRLGCDAVAGQRAQMGLGFVGTALVALAQRDVAQHQVLPRGALHGQRQFVQALGVRAQRERACGVVAALFEQRLQRQLPAQRHAAQQQCHQHEGGQQQLAE